MLIESIDTFNRYTKNVQWVDWTFTIVNMTFLLNDYELYLGTLGRKLKAGKTRISIRFQPFLTSMSMSSRTPKELLRGGNSLFCCWFWIIIRALASSNVTRMPAGKAQEIAYSGKGPSEVALLYAFHLSVLNTAEGTSWKVLEPKSSPKALVIAVTCPVSFCRSLRHYV